MIDTMGLFDELMTKMFPDDLGETSLSLVVKA